jgi:S1-C subfamily serine protease
VILVVGIVALVALLIGGLVVMSGSDDEVADGPSTTTTVAGSTSFPPPPPIEPPPGGWTAESIGQTYGEAVWRVDTFGCGFESGGTAFAISPTHLVTNWHVVVSDTEPTLVSRDGSRTLQGHVIGMQQEPDVALIQVDEPLPMYVDWAPTAELSEGQELVAVGFPRPQINYTVTQLHISSFEMAADQRSGILVFGAIDRGNSGGPSFTLDGRVAGINTKVNINSFSEGGLQTVPYLVSTHSAKPAVDAFLANTNGPTVPADCAKVDPKLAETYGDNEQLDELWELCEQGDAIACDWLAQEAKPQSDYYVFGTTCGNRGPRQGYCYGRYGEVLPPHE